MQKRIIRWYRKAAESRITDLLFYMGLTLELIVVILDKSSFQNVYESYFFRVTFLLFFGKMLLTYRSGKQWVLVVMLELLGFLSYRITGENDVIRMVTFVAACRGMKLQKTLRYSFWVTLCGCACIVILAVTGLYGDMSLTQAYGRGVSAYEIYDGAAVVMQTRYTLGMGHPNALACMFLMLLAMGIYAYFDQLKWYAYLFLLFLDAGMFVLTDSKTSMLLAAALLLICCILRYGSRLRRARVVYAGGLLVFVICVLFSVDAAAHAREVRDAQWKQYYLGEETESVHIRLLVKADRALNGRIVSLTDTQREDGTVKTWSLMSESENMEHYFDMGWVKLFYRYGILPAMVYLTGMLLLLWYFYRRQNAHGLAVMTILSLYTVMEAHLISVYIGRNFLLLMMGCLLSEAALQNPKGQGIADHSS